MQFEHRLRTIPKETRTSAGSKFSNYNFATHKTCSSYLELLVQRSRSTTTNSTVARTLHNLSEK